MRIVVTELRYKTFDRPFLGSLKPYSHQLKTLAHIREALQKRQSICLENTSITGSGKTLANFAAAILDGARTCGVYPTNELLLDQYISLESKFSSGEIAILDSQGLDDITSIHSHMRSHAQALAWATGDHMPIAVLTNPDVLYLAMYNLYGQMFSTFHLSYGARVFQHILNNYPIIAFDEFHLYSAKQIANAAFIMGTAKTLAPEKPHVFIFSSATPQEHFQHYVRSFGMEVISVTDEASIDGRVVCEPITIDFLPGNLLRWQGVDAIFNQLDDILQWADSSPSPARGVFIVDSVYDAKCLAAELRRRYPTEEVGEVHGYMAPDERSDALRRRFSVGTTTIDVGVDLTGQKHKDFLICEGRSAAQAIQRIGRLGRHGRETSHIEIPNHIWLVVPEYVYHYIEPLGNGKTMTREEFNEMLNTAYLGHETFSAYTIKYSPLEAVAACERIKQQYFEDGKDQAYATLQTVVTTLYEKQLPSNQEQATQSYAKYRKTQLALWKKFGTEIKSPSSTKKHYYLSDLESFRGGMESDFTVVLYDELDRRLGLKPLKTYSLPFVLRRTQYDEVRKQDIEQLLQRNHPEQATDWLSELERQHRVLGYIHVHDLLPGKANTVYFEISKMAIENQFHRVIRLQGLTIEGSYGHLRLHKESINGQLKSRTLNCWISEQNSFRISDCLHLPPLFTIYPLHAMNPGGSYSNWSIAFGIDAFLLESIARKLRWTRSRADESAFLL